MAKFTDVKSFIEDPEILEGYSDDGGGTSFRPKYLIRPESPEELRQAVKICLKENIPLTPSGARTCDTGSGLSDQGLLFSTEKLKRIIEINEDECYCDVEPGILLYDLKEALAERGFFYPPDPSSEKIATIGGTVATNAGGARSLKYGQTVNHVLGMEVLTGDGEISRIENYRGSKSATGPACLQKQASLFVGSEGIFGPFTSLRLKIYRGVPDAYALCIFFELESSMHDFSRRVVSGDFPNISPRSMEFMDASCLRLIRDSGKFPKFPKKGQFAVICEQEYLDGEKSTLLDNWFEVLERGGALLEETIVADSPVKISELRELRHCPPSSTWEMGKEVQGNGGKKVSTDWAVPVLKLESMMSEATKICSSFGFPEQRVFRYAHLGSGHPHFNFVSENPEETSKALKLREELSKLAIKFGGTVAGEHGVGKLRKGLFNLENDKGKLKLLRALKGVYDPNGIFSPGNII